MADRGIIFSAPMVRALLDGRKTQTRRLLTRSLPPSDADQVHSWFAPPDVPAKGIVNEWAQSGVWAKKAGEQGYNRYCGPLPHRPGDRLYVRERLRVTGEGIKYGSATVTDSFAYEAEVNHAYHPGRDLWLHKWNPDRTIGIPSIHMPRWASRMTLLVREVRVQRLQDISEEDARAEGAIKEAGWHYGQGDDWLFGTAKSAFRHLWNCLHTKPGERWEDDPWIYALTFEVVRENIDRILA